MESNFAKVLVSRRSDFVDMRRNKAVGFATYLARASRVNVSRNSALTAALKSPSLKLGKRKKPDVCKNKCRSCKLPQQRSLARYYTNFMRSGLPKRLMCYQNGGWVDNDSEIIAFVRKEFESRKSAVEVKLSGHHLVFDFVRMVQFNYRTSSELPLAWIDEHGSCFFPEVFTDNDEQYGYVNHEKQKEEISSSSSSHGPQEIKLQIEIEVNGIGDNKVLEYCGETSPLVKRIKIGQNVEMEDSSDKVSDVRANESLGENPEYVVSVKVSTDHEGSVLKNDHKLEVKPVPETRVSPSRVGAAVDMASDHKSDVTHNGSKETTSLNSSTVRVPKSPWMPFPMLLAAISKKVPSTDMKTLLAHYEQFKTKVTSRESFVKNLRQVVGDTILKTTITELNSKVSAKNGTLVVAQNQEIAG